MLKKLICYSFYEKLYRSWCILAKYATMRPDNSKERGIELRKRLKNMSVRAKLILSFASIVLLTTLAVNISFFSVVEGNYIAEIDRYNQMTLEILVSNLDEQFFEPASIYASEMAANSTIFTEISAIIRKTESASPIQIQRVYELLRGFSYHDMNLFTDVMVYFGDQHFTIANTNGIVYLDIDDKNNPGELWWVEAIRNASTQSLWLYGNINPSVTQQGLIYAVGYPSIHPGSSQMNGFAFQYPENALADFMRRYRQTGTEYYLIGPDGVLLYGDAEAYAAISDRDALETAIASTSREMLNIKLSGVDSILNATKTSFGQFTLIAITPTDFMYEQANALRALLQGIGVITFLLGLLLSFFLTRSLYRPLKEIRLANRHPV